MNLKYLLAVTMISTVFACSSKDDGPLPDGPGNPPPPGPNNPQNVGWTTLSPNMGKLQDVFFLNDSTGYICGEKIARTTDRGNTWTSFQLPHNKFYKLYFRNAARGWALDSSKLYRTVDSGRNWTAIDYPLETAYDFQFTSNTNGYLGGKGGLFRTNDGGVSWTSLGLSSYHISHLNFADDQMGWFVHEGLQMTKTLNGGTSFGGVVWGADSLRATQLLSTTTGYRLDKKGTLAQTTSAGSDFINPIEFGATARDFHFVAQDNGYVMLSNSISKVKDRKPANSLDAGNNLLTGLYFTDENHGWAVAASGTMYRYVK